MSPTLSSEPPSRRSLENLHPILQWALLACVSGAAILLLEFVGFPATALIGPMIIGAAAGANGATIRVSPWFFAAAQALIGILIAKSVELEIIETIIQNWPIVIGGVLSTLIASSYLGWQISRWGILPGATAILGSAPGAASAMVLMAGAFGADFRLVAFMQYLRVAVVALVAAALAAFLVDPVTLKSTSAPMFASIDWPTFALTMLIALAGATCGRLLRLPTPYFLGTLILGIALHLGLGVAFELPPLLLSLGYVMIGWSIGLNFTKPIVKHAARALPQVLGSILLLILLSALVGWLLSEILDIDFLTAYLATSPGGMDAVAIIAAASGNANMSLIMAMQMARFLIVLLLGPVIVRVLAKSLKE